MTDKKFFYIWTAIFATWMIGAQAITVYYILALDKDYGFVILWGILTTISAGFAGWALARGRTS